MIPKLFKLSMMIKGCWNKNLYFRIIRLIVWLGIFISSSKSSAQNTVNNIIKDETLGVNSSQVINNFQGRPIDVITGGVTREINLFHSFREFNISSGRGAYFLSPNTSIQNILVRVTGKNYSEIFGTLGTLGGSQPNLFLINPNGIIFGENASLDIGGSFIATTANAVKLGETGFFSANESISSNLLSVNPSALFYNSFANQAQIVNRSVARNNVLINSFNGLSNRQINGLQVIDGKSLLLVGGNILVEHGILMARGGKIELGGLSASGIVELKKDGNIFSLNFPDVLHSDVLITDKARVDVRGVSDGTITINARNFEVSEESTIRAGLAPRLGQVNTVAGNITINAQDRANVLNKSFIVNTIGEQTAGEGGEIKIAANSLFVNSGAEIVASNFGQGNASNIVIEARNFFLDGDNTIARSRLEQGGIGKGGNINITTDSISLTNGARLSVSTFGQGDAGNININARNILFDGKSSDQRLTSAISSTVEQRAIGNGGEIRITGDLLSLKNGAEIVANTRGVGNASNVNLDVKNITLDATSKAFSRVEKTASGNGGDIDIMTNSLSLTNGAQLSTSSLGDGDAGKIQITAEDSIIISGRNSVNENFSGLFTSIDNFSGQSSNINAGNITVTSPRITLDRGGRFVADSTLGDGGNINLKVDDLLLLRNGGQISTNAGTNRRGGDGGNININSKFIVAIPKENSDITANAFTGTGGRVEINAQGIFGIESRLAPTSFSDITASSRRGISGITILNIPENSFIQNNLVELPRNIIDTTALIANSCIAPSQKKSGSFIITGSGGLPERPGDMSPSIYATGEVRGIENMTRSWEGAVIEPSGVYRLENGQLVMSRECP